MSQWQWFDAVFLFWSILFVLGMLDIGRRRVAKARRADASAQQHLETIQKALTDAESGVARMECELRAQREAAELSRRKHDDIVTRIEGILGERDDWRRRYLEQAAGASSAQSMMLVTIQNLCRQLLASGQRPRLSATMRLVLDEVAAETHVDQIPGAVVGSGTPAASPGTGTQSSATPADAGRRTSGTEPPMEPTA